ncbi:hypothetical protein ABDK56_00170 [Sphingomonas sp. ASV193]|uniref:hypothetical protein n=1 Tax=Sphingomonas sp. ASV193 TaxID=3144405 RepID=UPI0032E9008E
MIKSILAVTTAAIAFTAIPAEARTYSNVVACSGWRDGQCTSWNRLTNKQAREVSVGTVFGPNYTYYSAYDTLPQAVVTQYGLTDQSRYVTANGYIYVVDPTSYAVTKVITLPAQ